jgi:hypothetical protein
MASNSLPIPLMPPPDGEYLTSDQEYSSILAWSRLRNYGITKLRSILDKQKPPTTRRIDFNCDKGPDYYTPAGELKEIKLKRVSCRFELHLQRDATLGRWRLITIEGRHVNKEGNICHSPLKGPLAHICHWRLSNKDRETITLSKLHPRDIETSLLTVDPNITIKKRDIYNAKAQFKKEILGSLTPVEALLETLQKDLKWRCQF